MKFIWRQEHGGAGEREKTGRIIERMLAQLRREIEMLSPSCAYRRRGRRAKAIKRVKNVESFRRVRGVQAECETTRSARDTHARAHTPKRKTTFMAVGCRF